MKLRIVIGILVLFLSNTAFADRFTFSFDMPAFQNGPMSGQTSRLDVTVDNGGSSLTNQSYRNTDVVAMTVTRGGNSISLNADDHRSFSSSDVVYITTNSAGRGTLRLNASVDSHIVFIDGEFKNGTLQLATNVAGGPTDYAQYAVWFPGQTGISTITQPLVITQNEACTNAVDCARQAEFAPYDLGLEGWDRNKRRWVTPTELRESPYSSFGGTGPGIDCSGLVEWSRSLANGQGYTDKGSWQLCSDTDSIAVSDSNRRAGDIMCFDYNGDGVVDHMAMFAGSGRSGPEFVEAVYGFGLDRVAVLPVQEIDTSPTRSAAFRRSSCDDCGYRRLKSTATPPAISFQSQSPITLRVTDPDGNVIDRGTIYESRSERAIAIPDVLYYTFIDGEHDTVYSPVLKQGAYYVSVVPKEGADPNDTYSLITLLGGVEATKLAETVRVAEIPNEGYGVAVEGSVVTAFAPLTIRVLQKNVNLRSRGVIPVAVLSTQAVDANELDLASLRFGPGGAQEAHGMLHMEDVNGDGTLDSVLHFRTRDASLNALDAVVSLKGQLVDGTKVQGQGEIEIK